MVLRLHEVRARARRWLELAKLLPRAGKRRVALAATLNLLFGVTPIVFIVCMSRLLAAIPARANVLAGLALAVGALAAQQFLGPFQAALGEVIARRIDGHCVQRLMSASFRRIPIPALEEQSTSERLTDVRAALDRTFPTPGDAAAGLFALLARYTQLLGAVVLVGVYLNVWAGLAMLLTALAVRSGQRGTLTRFSAMWEALAGLRKQLAYVRGLATGTQMAKEIQVLGLRSWLSERLDAEVMGYFREFWAGRRRLQFWPFVWLAGVGLAGATIGLVLLARETASGRLSLLEFGVAVQAMLIPVRFGTYFPECDSQTQFGMSAYGSLRGFEERARQAPAQRGSGVAVGRPRKAVRFENVGFGYPEGKKIFSKLDLELPAGRSTAIVGLNGAGKTTLVKLLARFYEPDSGRITVDGRDLRRVDLRQWHAQLAVIFQDFIRYELTGVENVGLGAADVEAVRRAARKAKAPSDLDGVLFARYAGGRDLSGGQWQRVALARAMFAMSSGAGILVLDEPTAQLDVRGEVEFFDRFLAHTRGMTSIVISHRFSTVRRADKIVVLEHGRVAEQGSHDQLLALGGRYAELFHLQAKRFSPELEEVSA